MERSGDNQAAPAKPRRSSTETAILHQVFHLVRHGLSRSLQPRYALDTHFGKRNSPQVRDELGRMYRQRQGLGALRVRANIINNRFQPSNTQFDIRIRQA